LAGWKVLHLVLKKSKVLCGSWKKMLKSRHQDQTIDDSRNIMLFCGPGKIFLYPGIQGFPKYSIYKGMSQTRCYCHLDPICIYYCSHVSFFECSFQLSTALFA